jgi:nucleotide-binding universal stress UspA family protein
MKNILVPFDFSKHAIDAYRFAHDVVQQSKGSIHLLHVIQLPVVSDGIVAPVLNFEEQLLKELVVKAEKQFSRVLSKYPPGSVHVNSHIEFGSVSETIVGYINKNAIDLVLMGSHGATGLREVFIGSNAEKIVRRSPVPVIVMKQYYKGPVKNIIFPNTLETEHQEDLVMKAKALQNFFGAKLHIVWINTPSNFTADHETLTRLEGFARRYMFKDYTLNVFNDVDEENGILNFAKLVDGDLIAIGTHSRTGVSHLINGSIAEDIVNHGSKLVWTYSLKNEPVLSR